MDRRARAAITAGLGEILVSKGKDRNTAADVVRTLRQEKYDALDLKFVDLFGALQHVTVPTEQVDEGLFGKGFGFDGSSVRGFRP